MEMFSPALYDTFITLKEKESFFFICVIPQMRIDWFGLVWLVLWHIHYR